MHRHLLVYNSRSTFVDEQVYRGRFSQGIELSQPEFSRNWTAVDQTGSSQSQSYLTQVSALEAAKIDKPMHFSMLDITSGNHGLDVGCGNGDDGSARAGSAGKAGLVVGSESRKKMSSGEPLTDDTWSKATVEGTIATDANFASVPLNPDLKSNGQTF